MDGQLLCNQRSNGGFAGHQLLDIATQRKPTQIFSTIFIASRQTRLLMMFLLCGAIGDG
jgi:hypothetical protein